MIQKVQKKMDELNMVAPKDKLLVGVSGGADSVCLLLVLSALKDMMSFDLEAIHVEHGIRGDESKADADFVVELCQKLGVDCQMVSVDVPAYCEQTGLGTEEAARILRYNAFSTMAKQKNAKVALAHHMEDNAETILFQMARGSSLTGLCGMQPMRVTEDGVTYIRPLLSFHRSEIEEYLVLCGQGYRTDSTNKELEYSRNFLRHKVLPQLSEVNARAVDHINDAAKQLSEIREYLSFAIESHWDEVAEVRETWVFFDLEKLMALHKVIQKELIYHAIAITSGSKKDITSAHVESVLALCHNQSGKQVNLPNGIFAKRDFIHLILGVAEDADVVETPVFTVSKERLEEALQSGEPFDIALTGDGGKLIFRVFSYQDKSVEIPKKTYTKWFDCDKIEESFCIRNRLSGDYFIGDDEGHHKKLKQYFIDEKISASKRGRMWLLAQEQLVLWLIGGRDSAHLKVTEKTKTILEIVYKGGN